MTSALFEAGGHAAARANVLSRVILAEGTLNRSSRRLMWFLGIQRFAALRDLIAAAQIRDATVSRSGLSDTRRSDFPQTVKWRRFCGNVR